MLPRRRRHAGAGLGGTVPMLHGPAPAHCATGDGIRRGQPSPGAKVCVIGPRAHVGANLSQNRLRHGIAHPMDGHEVHARDAEEVGTGVALGSVLAVRVGLATRREGGGRAAGRRGRRNARLDHGEDACNLRVAGAALRRVALAQCQGLCEDKDGLLAPRAGQRAGRSRPHPSCQRSLRKAARCCGSRSPATMARMIRCPVVPVTALRAGANWMCICNSACCYGAHGGSDAQCVGRDGATGCAAPRSAASGRNEAASHP